MESIVEEKRLKLACKLGKKVLVQDPKFEFTMRRRNVGRDHSS